METLRLRVGGHDLRKEMFKGWVEVERFVYRSSEGSFCVMKRDEVSVFFWCVP
jgi:serine/threonine-protein kinase CHEK1